MTQLIENSTPETRPEVDLASATQRVLATSSEPLTLSRIRSRLPVALRSISLEELEAALRRLVAANVLHVFPRYRSQQERYWDRGMPVHLANLLREMLEAKPLALSELRRKLPAYAVPTFEAVLNDQLAQGLLHRHPPATKRGPERIGASPADPKSYLVPELTQAFTRLEALGFSRVQLREAAIELLHEEEWGSNLSGSEATADASTPQAADEADEADEATAGAEMEEQPVAQDTMEEQSMATPAPHAPQS